MEKSKLKLSWKKILIISLVLILAAIVAVIWMNMGNIKNTDSEFLPRRAQMVTLHIYHYATDSNEVIYSEDTYEVEDGTTINTADWQRLITGYSYSYATDSPGGAIMTTLWIDHERGDSFLYLYYEPLPKYTVTFNHYENGTTTKIFTGTHTINKFINEPITLADYKKTITGYSYTKATLSTNTSSAITSHTVTADVTINMYYTRNTYTITIKHINYYTKELIKETTHSANYNQWFNADSYAIESEKYELYANTRIA